MKQVMELNNSFIESKYHKIHRNFSKIISKLEDILNTHIQQESGGIYEGIYIFSIICISC
jgi:hypothetical protein